MNKINNEKFVRTVISFSAAVGIFSAAHAGVPLNNLQGAGGIAFNPLAYTAGRPWDGADGGDSTNEVEHSSLNGIVSKLRLLDENAFDTSWVPAIAVGGIYKYTDSRTVDALKLDHDGFDAYVVASKLITQTPWPVLLSAGLLYTDEVVNGVVGHNDYDLVAFGNIDVLPASNVAIGLEYKQGARVGDGIRNHDYYDGHVAWFVTDSLTLVAAYVQTGDKDKFYRHGSAKDLGVGSGLVFSVQYQF